MSRPRIHHAVSFLSTVAVATFATSCGNPASSTAQQNALASEKTSAEFQESRIATEAPTDRAPEDVVAALLTAEEASRRAPMQETFEAVKPGRAYPIQPLSEIAKDQARVVFPEHTDLADAPPTKQTEAISFRTVTNRGASIKRFDSFIKQQSERGWCTAFAVIGAMENLLNQQGKRYNLSEIHHWSHYEEYQSVASAHAATQYWITREKIWPYRGARPLEVESKGVAKAKSVEILKSPAQVMAALDEGIPSVLSVHITEQWFSSKGPIVASGTPIGGHAVAIVGYEISEKAPGGGYFTIKNSWDSEWADGGYGYVPFSYCARYWCSFIKIDGVMLKGNPKDDPKKDGKITSADFTQMISYGGFQHGAKAYQVSLKASADVLKKVRDVRYNLSPIYSFPPSVRVDASPEAHASGFQSPLAFTPANAWRTKGAVVTLTNGESIEVPGMAVRW